MFIKWFDIWLLGSSPFGSGENLNRLAETPVATPSDVFPSSQKTHIVMSSPTDPTLEISQMVNHKRNSLMNRITSIDSEVSEDVSPSCNASESGSMTVNPVYGTRLLSTNSYRSTYSDSEIEVIFNCVLDVWFWYYICQSLE